MSDTVDDLHGAEDLAGQLAAALEDLMGVEGGEPSEPVGVSRDAWAAAYEAMVAYTSYCRPSCGAGRTDVVSIECANCDGALEEIDGRWATVDYRGTNFTCGYDRFAGTTQLEHTPVNAEDGDRRLCDDDPECCGCLCHNRYDRRHEET